MTTPELRGLRWTVVMLFSLLVIGSTLTLGISLISVIHRNSEADHLIIRNLKSETNRLAGQLHHSLERNEAIHVEIKCLIVEALSGNRHAVRTCHARQQTPRAP